MIDKYLHDIKMHSNLDTYLRLKVVFFMKNTLILLNHQASCLLER